MLNKNVSKNGKKTASIMGAALITAGALSSVSPPAMAYNGTPDPGTGIVWGTGDDGSYMIPTNGGLIQGYCIDAGKAFPTQNGNAVPYTDPIPWGGQLSEGDRQRLFLALLAGKAVAEGQVPHQLIDFLRANEAIINTGLGFIGQPPINLDFGGPNDIAAGVSYIVHEVGQVDGLGNWNPGSMNNQRAINFYDTINRFSMLWTEAKRLGGGIIPNVDSLTQFSVRNPTGPGAEGRQRMISMSDLRLEMPRFEIPTFNIPSSTSTPTTTPRTTSTPTSKTTRTSTSTTKSIPGTPTEKTTRTETEETTTTRTKTTTTETTPEKTTNTTTKTTSETPETTVETNVSTTPFTPYKETTTTTSTTEEEKPDVQIRTSAGTKSSNVVEVGRTITDTVTYQGLIPKKQYTIVGELVDKETGKKTGDKAVAKFETKTANGNVDIQIPVKNAYSDEIVVFETLFDSEGKKVAEHHDLKDRAQTVGRPLSTPEIRTSVDSSTGNNIQSGTSVNDTVHFKGLVKGRKYRLEARLMCAANGQDTGAFQTHEFVADAPNGSTVVENIAVTDPDCLKQVAFEKLYEVKEDNKGVLIATHEDMNDQAQTFGGDHVAKKKKKVAPKKKETPKPVTSTTTVPTPVPAPAPASVPGASAPAPRQVINSVPSGETSNYGSSIFNR